MKQFLIGSYAPEGEPSIFGVELDEEKQKLRLLWEDGQVQNPSFLYLHPNCHVLYAVEERVPNGGLAVMIKIEEGWLLKERLLAGSAPCHLEMTPDARYLLVSNYMDGTIGVYRADESGMNVVQTDLVCHQGKGVNPTRQEGPHVHSCLVIGEKIYSADLGLDTIFVYELNPADGKLEECGQIHMPDGCGVRHLAHQPGSPYLYANAEMGGDVFVIDLREGQIKQTHRRTGGFFRSVPNERYQNQQRICLCEQQRMQCVGHHEDSKRWNVGGAFHLPICAKNAERYFL